MAKTQTNPHCDKPPEASDAGRKLHALHGDTEACPRCKESGRLKSLERRHEAIVASGREEPSCNGRKFHQTQEEDVCADCKESDRLYMRGRKGAHAPTSEETARAKRKRLQREAEQGRKSARARLQIGQLGTLLELLAYDPQVLDSIIEGRYAETAYLDVRNDLDALQAALSAAIQKWDARDDVRKKQATVVKIKNLVACTASTEGEAWAAHAALERKERAA